MINNRLSLKIITVGCLFLAVACISGLHAQETEWEVSGTITDQSGKSLLGVYVAIKGTARWTISKKDGKYTLAVPENAVLEFSYIGYKKMDIAVKYQSVIDVVMKDIDYEPKGIKPVKYIDLTWKQRDMANAGNEFGFKMFKEISKLQGENTFFSPFSLNMAMGMLYNGASGDTRTEMGEIIGVNNNTEIGLNEYYRFISQEFLEIDPSTEIAIANAIWFHDRFQVKETFIDTGKEYFDADIRALYFGDPKAANAVNDWVSNRTRGRINNIVANPLQGDMVLTNAIYFKSKWQKEKKFDKEKTKPDDFTKSDNSKSRVNMMEQTTVLPYYADKYLQCVELPYGNQTYNMIAILPPKNGNPDQLIEYLSGYVEWDLVMKKMKLEDVWLKIPRFRIECELPLNESLKNVGIGQIFKGGFQKIADNNPVVSNILQKTFVEVNEEGAEAAAATAVIIVTGGILKTSKEPVLFFANRPFLFLIREKSTGVILFIGRIDDPREIQ